MHNADFRRIFVLCAALIALAAGPVSCGGGLSGDTGGETVVIAQSATCIDENDCDGDGLFADCDADDGDADNDEIASGCDEDEDGYVDTPCTTYEDIDGDGFFADAERVEYGANCDVCPDMYDPDQEDENADGVGDLCAAIEVNVSLNAEPPVETAEAGETAAADDSGDAAETADAGSEAAGDEGEDVDPDDADGDGLLTSIDPDPEFPNSWGYINAQTAASDACVPEKKISTYDYFKGYYVAKALGLATSVSPGIGQVSASAGRVTVSGVADASKASLTTYACPGDSSETDFSYGIYVVSSALKAEVLEAPVNAAIGSLIPNQ